MAIDRILGAKTVPDKPTSTVSKTTTAKTNGDASRKCPSWIESFIESTESLESPRIYRRWAAISTIAAAVEQRVFMISGGDKLNANIYCGLIGHPGVGKTRSIRRGRAYYATIEAPFNAPTSLTEASMVDALMSRKRQVMMHTQEVFEYNTMYITADELNAFMGVHDQAAIGTMSAFYDPDPYGHERRHAELKIKMKSPQLNIIVGTTPSNLIKYMPETAWEQGFTSRFIFVFSDERTIGDDFAYVDSTLNPDLVHDLRCISGLVGQFEITKDFRDLVNQWRKLGEPPAVSHPKLIHYGTRRRVHLYKLAMVSAIDRSDLLVLTREDFNRAMTWMTEAEMHMPDIFKAGAGNADAKAMDEIYHYVLTEGSKGPVVERKVVRFAKNFVPLNSIERVIQIMIMGGYLRVVKEDFRTKQKYFKAEVPEIDTDGNLL